MAIVYNAMLRAAVPIVRVVATHVEDLQLF